MTTIQTAQNNVTQLRVAFERLATCEQDKIAERFQDLACIIQSIQYDAMDLKEERLIEAEKTGLCSRFLVESGNEIHRIKEPQK